MTPEEIAWKIVEKWWPLSATMMGDIRLREAIASAVRAERERSDELQQVFDLHRNAQQRAIKRWQDAHHGNDLVWPDSADLTVWLLEERDRLREALERIKGNQVRAHHDFRIDACHIASEALARAKGESDG